MAKPDPIQSLLAPGRNRKRNWTADLSDEHRTLIFKIRRQWRSGEIKGVSLPVLFGRFQDLTGFPRAESTWFAFFADDGRRYPEPTSGKAKRR